MEDAVLGGKVAYYYYLLPIQDMRRHLILGHLYEVKVVVGTKMLLIQEAHFSYVVSSYLGVENLNRTNR